jgi:serine protease Do
VADAGSDGGDTNNPAAAGSGLVARRLGISVQPVTPAIAQELQLPADARGLLVSDVTPGGPAWDVLADEERGGPDIILSVESKPVKTKADLDAALKAEKPGSVVTLRVYNPRQQGRRVERIKLGDAP